MFKKIALSAAALSVAACASTPYVPTLYDRELAAVDSIVLASDPLPDQVLAAEGATDGANMASATASAVPIAGIFVAAAAAGVAARAQQIRHNKINDALEVTGYDPEGSFIASLTLKLEDLGYAVAIDETTTERDKRDFVEKYDAMEGGDAVLDVVASGFGFQRANKREDWRPVAFVDVRLIDRETGDMLLDHKIRYNPLFDAEGTMSIDPAADLTFASIDDFNADPASMAAAIEEMTDAITTEIAGLLE